MRNHYFIVVLIVLGWFCVWSSNGLEAAIPKEEREALIAFYQTLEGDSWKHKEGWRQEPLEFDDFGPVGSEGTWKGVTVSGDHVIKIEFNGNRLKGVLPPQLAALKYLETLMICDYGMNGEIPPEWGGLEQLRELILNGMYSGELPHELGRLVNLETLSLAGIFGGDIPQELGNLTHLQSLHLSGKFSGTLPDSLQRLVHLKHLSIDWPDIHLFSSNAEAESFQLKRAQLKGREREEYIDSISPQSPGILSSALGKMTQLETLCITGGYTGTLPPELARLRHLKKLLLQRNRFSGPIPPEIGNLTNLEELNLGDNRLSGPIPVELGNLYKLKSLNLGGNRLDGPIPTELGGLLNVETLNLAWNQLSGPIPGELGRLQNLQYLWLQYNHLSDTIPPELGNLWKLQQLLLDANQLSGEILLNLSSLNTYLMGLGYNALFTEYPAMKPFLERMQTNWSHTQTVAPSQVKATVMADASVLVSWVPIKYKDDRGYYEVYYRDSARGAWTVAGQTADKRKSSFAVRGLQKGKTYYFLVRTITAPHPKNPNTVTSRYSTEAKLILK